MFKYVLKRLCLMLLSLFIIMTMLFVLIRMLPNSVESVQGGYDKALSDMRQAWGYNKPVLVQYGIFLKNVFTKWDWGFCTTLGTFLEPVDEYLMSKLPATVYLNIFSLILSIPMGLIFGIIAAVNKNKWPDHIIQFFIMLFISVPSFVYAFLLQYFIGFKLNLCPLVFASGNDWFSWTMFHSAILPVLALSFGPIAGQMRLIRAELTESLTSDYMLLAVTKGLSKKQATVKHALRNSLVPLIPGYLADFLSVIAGSMIIEQIFAVPGIGKTYLLSISLKDYSVFMMCSMFYISIGLAAGILFDLSYGFIDPRIRMGGNKSNEL
ncbi:ABC transporter permease [Treponema sp.]|uniref:ABC transporter permease n=1 Tax=Treponema sp. TaxID=166 RepID=UPI0025E0BEEC|nr:ABC transporter permease [Treponema sp.]MCR5217458.1 ABC transporter permease [Treponema sp.]